MKKRTFSIRTSVILCLLVSIIPVDLMFIVFSNHSIRSIFEKTKESYRMSIDSAAAVFEESFRDIENGLAALYINSIDVRYLKNAATPEERYHYAYSLSQALRTQAARASPLSTTAGSFISPWARHFAEDKRSMRQPFSQPFSPRKALTLPAGLNPPGTAGLQGLWAAGRLSQGGRWAAAGSDVALGQSAGVFCRSGRRPITEIAAWRKSSSCPWTTPETAPFSRRQLSYGGASVDTLPAILVCAVSSASLISDLRFSQAVFWGLILLSAFSVAFTLLFLHRRVTKPLKDLRGNILSLRNSAYEWRSGSGAAREIQQVYDTFDSMTEEIKELRIRFYEEELQKQSTGYSTISCSSSPIFT
ncbi:MAG: hypothetical protein ACLRJV_18345 [Eubacteriales bacterium]